jgi:hypothetical protein
MQLCTNFHMQDLTPSVLSLLLSCMQSGFGGGTFQDRHTTDMGGGMQSILERNDLDELMAMVSSSSSSITSSSGGSSSTEGGSGSSTGSECVQTMHG